MTRIGINMSLLFLAVFLVGCAAPAGQVAGPDDYPRWIIEDDGDASTAVGSGFGKPDALASALANLVNTLKTQVSVDGSKSRFTAEGKIGAVSISRTMVRTEGGDPACKDEIVIQYEKDPERLALTVRVHEGARSAPGTGSFLDRSFGMDSRKCIVVDLIEELAANGTGIVRTFFDGDYFYVMVKADLDRVELP